MAVIQIVVDDEIALAVERGASEHSLSKSTFGLIALKRGIKELVRLGFINLDTSQVEPGLKPVSNSKESEVS